jgi:hypothetical protein
LIAEDMHMIRGTLVALLDREHDMDAGIRNTMVTSHNGRLVAYYTGSPEGIRDALLKRLPGHIVPSQFVAVSAFPLTRSGKVDREAGVSYQVRTGTEVGLAVGIGAVDHQLVADGHRDSFPAA